MSDCRRLAFSLMEVIIATAVLAASGAALFALIGQAAGYASKAQTRSEALLAAQTALDEYLAGVPEEELSRSQTEGERRWQIEIADETLGLAVSRSTSQMAGGDPSSVAGSSQMNAEDTPLQHATPMELRRVTVQVFASPQIAGGSRGGDAQPIVELTTWSRLPKRGGVQ